MAVGRTGVPGVHERQIATRAGALRRLRMARYRACCRGASAGRSCIRTKTIHLPSGETLGKLLLMPFSDAPTTRSGVAAPAVVERYFVEVVLDLRLVGIVGVCASACSRRG